MGIDETSKFLPKTSREWSKNIRMNNATIEKVNNKCRSMGLPGTGKAICELIRTVLT